MYGELTADQLRVLLADAEAVIIKGQGIADVRTKVWWALDDYDGSMDALKWAVEKVLKHFDFVEPEDMAEEVVEMLFRKDYPL